MWLGVVYRGINPVGAPGYSVGACYDSLGALLNLPTSCWTPGS